MARYMLDTNICIYLMKNQPVEAARRFAACQVGDVVLVTNGVRDFAAYSGLRIENRLGA